VTAGDGHQPTIDAFSAYLEGELSPSERARVDGHLSRCIECRVALERFRQTLGKLGSLRRPAPGNFLQQVQTRINRRSHGRFFAKRFLLFGRIPFEWLSLATIVAMLVYYIILMQSSPAGVIPAAQP
jgi:anti-sigma factor RsiW